MSALPTGPPAAPPFWTVLAEFPLTLLRAFVYPRSVVRGFDWSRPFELQRLALYLLLWLGLMVWALSDNRLLADDPHPSLGTLKGVTMRAHDRSWDDRHEGWSWLRLDGVYGAFHQDRTSAKRLWDNILTSGFVAYALLAGLLATAVLARLRMWRFGLSWDYALGTGMLAYITAATALALSLAPLMLLLVCRNCTVRLALWALLLLAGWAYYGYYTLADLGERPRGTGTLLLRSLGWGLAQFVVAYLIFLVLIAVAIPLV